MQLNRNLGKIEVIAAEPGGDEAILARLRDRGVDGLKFDVKSDPGGKYVFDD